MPAVRSDYDEVVEPHRSELHAHAHRMLGSFHDAEDAVQEALTRAWRSLPTVQHRGALRAWLYRITTNTSLDEIDRRQKRPGPLVHDLTEDPHAATPVGMEPDRGSVAATPGRRHDLEATLRMTFALLPETQSAVLILRYGLDFSARETAELLGTTVAAVNSALARARGTLKAKADTEGEAAALGAEPAALDRELVGDLADAWERDDIEGVIALLAGR